MTLPGPTAGSLARGPSRSGARGAGPRESPDRVLLGPSSGRGLRRSGAAPRVPPPRARGRGCLRRPAGSARAGGGRLLRHRFPGRRDGEFHGIGISRPTANPGRPSWCAPTTSWSTSVEVTRPTKGRHVHGARRRSRFSGEPRMAVPARADPEPPDHRSRRRRSLARHRDPRRCPSAPPSRSSSSTIARRTSSRPSPCCGTPSTRS